MDHDVVHGRVGDEVICIVLLERDEIEFSTSGWSLRGATDGTTGYGSSDGTASGTGSANGGGGILARRGIIQPPNHI
ncbi:hypothetical protein M0802_003585 [Mischocyttarus mexicanus]|nr:hypothetical protein M0802_003585 [Mischocyttarus mexicanus]